MDKKLLSKFDELLTTRDMERDLIARLTSQPMSEGELDSMLKHGRDNLEWALLQKELQPLLNDLREAGLIVQDTPQSWEDFKKDNPGYYCLRRSAFFHLTGPEYNELRNIMHRIVIYNDMDSPPIHYRYWKNGNWTVTGEGLRITVNTFAPTGNQDHDSQMMDKIREASAIGKEARTEINNFMAMLGRRNRDQIDTDNKKVFLTKGQIDSATLPGVQNREKAGYVMPKHNH